MAVSMKKPRSVVDVDVDDALLTVQVADTTTLHIVMAIPLKMSSTTSN